MEETFPFHVGLHVEYKNKYEKNAGKIQYVPKGGRIIWLWRETDGRLVAVKPIDCTIDGKPYTPLTIDFNEESPESDGTIEDGVRTLEGDGEDIYYESFQSRVKRLLSV